MEIKTCEGYVLARLARLEEDYDEAVDKLAEKADEVKSLKDAIVWSHDERQRVIAENEELRERVRSLEATCSDFARKLDRAKRGLTLVDAEGEVHDDGK